jgi:[acyl-carrier-protein] S-malonyltransferase
MPSAAFIFPGQGSQVVGMGAELAARFAKSKECFERASTVLGYDLLERVNSASPDELKETRLSQPAIFTANVAIYRAVATLGLNPIASAGHSFGEYCSLTIADAIDFDEAVRIVNERGLAMGDAADVAPGLMAAIIGLEEAAVDEVCKRAREESGARVDIGNLNSVVQIVVSGDASAVEAACEIAKERGAKRVRVLKCSRECNVAHAVVHRDQQCHREAVHVGRRDSHLSARKLVLACAVARSCLGTCGADAGLHCRVRR